MLNKKFLGVILLITSFVHITLANYSTEYASTLALKDGTVVNLVPVTDTPNDLKSMKKILQDPDTASTMRDLKPWPDNIVSSTYAYYVASWKIFDDLIKMGEKPTSVALGFLVYNQKKEVLGLGGLQRSTRDNDYAEVFFCILPPYRKKGLGTAMCQHFMNFYKKYYKNRTLEAIVLPTNVPSKALLKKMGFKPLFDKGGAPITKTFESYGDVVYQVYRYTPAFS